MDTTLTSQNPVSTSQHQGANSASSITNRDHRLVLPRYCGLFEDFLSFAGINPSDDTTRDLLKQNRFDRWSDLRPSSSVSISVLGELGIPLGTARKLIEGADMYVDRVKHDIVNGGFQLLS